MANQKDLETLMERLAVGAILPEMAIGDAIDSLTFIDLFLEIEQEYDSAIALDDVIGCKTMGDLHALINTARASLNASGDAEQ